MAQQDQNVLPYLAHISADGRTQTVAEHCRNTAELSAKALQQDGLYQMGYLVGLLHDMGKCKQEFQQYLKSQSTAKGSVIHTFSAVRYLLESFHSAEDGYQNATAELLAYAVGAHHGLFDLDGKRSENGFTHRLDTSLKIAYRESRDGFLTTCAEEEEIRKRFAEAKEELQLVFKPIDELSQGSNADFYFYFGLLERLLLSALIDADRTDTASFMLGELPQRGERPNWNELRERVERHLEQFPTDTPISRARKQISEQCKSFAKQKGGIIRLNVPTGGGKTLSSLRYALAHAEIHGKDRIILTAPLLTILEQNSQVIREIIQDDSLILEHHSNVVTESNSGETLHLHEAMQENWDAPIIITTMVQFFHTLFSGKTSCIRRFHNLSHSIIIMDEVQTVPIKMLSLFNLAVNFLTKICGATVVLCSATQPEFGRLEHPLLGDIPEMVPYDASLWSIFQRTQLVNAGGMTSQNVAGFARSVLQESQSLLIVCNTKKEAASLYQDLSADGVACFHLSASMCQKHREKTLTALKTSLTSAEKTICVATQVIEAGVDISFGAVIRLCAGMDSVVQSAGRCNRNGENPSPVPVYIVTVLDEKLCMLPDIENGQKATISLLENFRVNPESYQNDLSSAQAISRYYRILYAGLHGGATDFPVGNDFTLLDLLGENQKYCPEDSPFLFRQAFKTAGENFTVFDEDTIDVLVPYDKGASLIAELQSSSLSYQPSKQKALLKEAHAYSVSVYEQARRNLERMGGLYWICEGTVAVLSDGYYSEQLGLMSDKPHLNFLEV